MGGIFKNYLYNIFYQVFLIIAPLLTAPYLARVLGATQLGIFNYVTSMTSIFATFGLLGFYNYGCRHIAYSRNYKEKVTNAFYELMIMRIALCVIATVLYFYFFANSKYSSYFKIQYLWLLAYYLDISWFFVGMEDMGPAVLKNFFAKFISIIGTFIFVETEEDLWIYVFLIAGMTLVANISIYPQIKKYIGKPSIDSLAFSSHLVGALRLFLPQIATMLYLQMGKVMIEFYTGTTEQVAFYDNAEKIVKIPLAFITALGIVMMPRMASAFSDKNNEKIREYVISVINFSSMLAFPMMVGIACLAAYFIPWYLGNEFLPVITAIIVLSPIIIANSFSCVSGTQYFTATNQMAILTFSYVCAAIVNFIFNMLLIPYYGFIGAATGTVAAEFVCVIIQYFILSKQINIKEIYAKALKYFIFSLLMGIVVFVTGFLMGPGILTTFAQVFLGTWIYTIILWLNRDDSFMFTLNRIIRTIQNIKR